MWIRHLAKLSFIVGAALLVGVTVWEVIPERRNMIETGPQQGNKQEASYKRIGYLPRLNVAYASPDGKLFGIEDHYVYVSDNGGKSFKQLGKLPNVDRSIVSMLSDKIARLKLVRLLRRNPGPRNLVVLESGTILVFWDHIYRSADGGHTFVPVFDFAAGRGIFMPFPSEGVTVGKNDSVYFGEYVNSKGPHSVRLVEGTRDGTVWRIIYTFETGQIRHVHSVQYDPFRDLYWITTGDRDSESSLLYTRDAFATLERLGGGSQDWRIVSLMITREALYWGSDNDQTSAAIFRWDFQENRLQKLADIGKVSYFSTVLRDGTLVLSTTYERESPFTRSTDPEPTSDIWISEDGMNWRKILSLPYERGYTLSGRPTRASISFPAGAPLNIIYYTPESTSIQDFTTQLISP